MTIETPLYQNKKGEWVTWENLTEKEKREAKRKARVEWIKRSKLKENISEFIDLLSQITHSTKLGAEKEIKRFLEEEAVKSNDDEKRILSNLEVTKTLLRQRLKETLVYLTPKEQKVLIMRFGLEDGITHTLEEVGKEFNITREKIHQIESNALAKIKQHQE